MKSAQIVKVSLLESKGIPYALIQTTNAKQPIIRGLKQFAIDLDESGRLGGMNPQFVTSINHPVLKKAAVALRGGTVEGDFQFTKAGEEYAVTENSSAITDKNHPQFGKVKIGDKLPREKDGVVVEGFLFLQPDMITRTIEANADAIAAQQAAIMGMFNSPASVASNDEDNTPDIDDAALQEALGAQATTVETE